MCWVSSTLGSYIRILFTLVIVTSPHRRLNHSYGYTGSQCVVSAVFSCSSSNQVAATTSCSRIYGHDEQEEQEQVLIQEQVTPGQLQQRLRCVLWCCCCRTCVPAVDIVVDLQGNPNPTTHPCLFVRCGAAQCCNCGPVMCQVKTGTLLEELVLHLLQH